MPPTMPLHPTFADAAARLAAAVIAGVVLGIDRSEHGKPAGLRTTVLVCLAAAVSMLQVNLLLGQAGKPAGSFVVLDLMRLPLGVLTGVGFIGAGAILRRGPAVRGITTAATLWVATVVGLCLGGGQYALGTAATAISAAVLIGLRRLEHRLPQKQTATLTLTRRTEPGTADPDFPDLRTAVAAAGDRVTRWCVTCDPARRRQTVHCTVRRHATTDADHVPPYVRTLAADPATLKVDWKG